MAKGQHFTTEFVKWTAGIQKQKHIPPSYLQFFGVAQLMPLSGEWFFFVTAQEVWDFFSMAKVKCLTQNTYKQENMAFFFLITVLELPSHHIDAISCGAYFSLSSTLLPNCAAHVSRLGFSGPSRPCPHCPWPEAVDSSHPKSKLETSRQTVTIGTKKNTSEN